MKISLDSILRDCPAKLLVLYPQIMERVKTYYDTPEFLQKDLEPLIIMIKGSRSCLHGDSELWTPNGKVKIKDFHGGEILAFDGHKIITAWAGEPVKYPATKLYKTELKDGSSFVSTSKHRILDVSSQFCSVQALSQPVIAFSSQQPSTWDTSPSTFQQDVRHLTGTVLSLIYRYWLDCYQCGEPLHLGVNTYQDVFPSLNDVRISDRYGSHKDDPLVRERIHDHLHQYISHFSTVDCLFHNVEQYFVEQGNDTYQKSFERIHALCQTLRQFHTQYNPEDTIRELCESSLGFLNDLRQDKNLSNILRLSSLEFDDNSFTDSFDIDRQIINACATEIKSITYYGEEEYYDLFVPYFHNYIANGVVHHNSGKSEFAQRASLAGIYDGYINNIKYSTMTENGLNGSKDAFERLAPECIGTGADTSKANPMHRFISGARIDFDFFGKHDIKNEQKKYDILICEEVEKWDKIQGVAALETEVRHCKVIILISNNPPQSVVEFVKTHNGVYLECNWWDNRALPNHIKEAYQRAKIESPVYYTRFIMCQNDVDAAQWFDTTGVQNFFSRVEEQLGDNERDFIYTVLGVDVGGGYGDESVIAKISRNTLGCLYVEVQGKYQLESPALCIKVGNERMLTGATEEVWDANGIGLTAMQQRAPDARTRMALGIVPFTGSSPASDKSIFNQRSEAYALWSRMINDNQCWYIGNPVYVDQIRREMYAQIYATAEQSKGLLRLAEKKDIKKNLNGESPNIADAIAMGIWRIITHKLPEHNIQANYELMHGGVVTGKSSKRWF